MSRNEYDMHAEALGSFWHECREEHNERVGQALFSVIFESWEDCESPIERRMLAALQFLNVWVAFPEIDGNPFALPIIDNRRIVWEDEGDFHWRKDLLHPVARVFVQPTIAACRADFLVTFRKGSAEPLTCLVIECDGHDFHERTKEQAKRDRSRDRKLQALNFKVFRFTGSEIFRDAPACVREIENYLRKT